MVIVISILLAFGIEAWWDGRQERVEERQALEALARDFESAAEEIDQVLLVMDSVAIAANWTSPDSVDR